MRRELPQVAENEILRQQEIMRLVRAMEARPQSYFIVSMGCQMNDALTGMKAM